MNESWFQIPGDPVVGDIVSVVAKVGGLFLIYMLILVIATFYLNGRTNAGTAIRRFTGIAASVPFSACMTHILIRQFHIYDKGFETFVFIVFIVFCCAITAFISQPESQGASNEHTDIKNN
ncbi:MAG: hypothetical protein A2283_14010 [Lentisphaerae bacterium RIFOXYA12_FULL_48_11]|nr:MAG: hypothetical protein A2283_14010 [Lentisphaerae bacterium RIFOXYA12_FULL_48_11]